MTDIDSVALEAANKIAKIKRYSLPGGDAQYVAKVQCLVIESIERASRKSGNSPGRALSSVEDAMNGAYNSAILVCCGVGDENGCCGSPEPDWPEWAQIVITALDPVQKELTQILRQIEQKKMAAEQAQEGDKS